VCGAGAEGLGGARDLKDKEGLLNTKDHGEVMNVH
jgi:hypothetical protein